MGQYTKEMYQQFRKEQDDKAAKAEEERREHDGEGERPPAWMADGGAEADFARSGRGSATKAAASA